MKNIQKNLLLIFLLSGSHLTKAMDHIDIYDNENEEAPTCEKINLVVKEILLDREEVNSSSDCTESYDHFITIDKMIEKDENKNFVFFEKVNKDIDLQILKFVPTKDLVACSHTSAKFYTLVNQFDFRHALLKFLELPDLNDLLKLQRKERYLNFHTLIQADIHRNQLMDSLSRADLLRKVFDKEQLKKVTNAFSLRFIAKHPVLNSLFTHNLSFSNSLLDLHGSYIISLYNKTPIAEPIYKYLRSANMLSKFRKNAFSVFSPMFDQEFIKEQELSFLGKCIDYSREDDIELCLYCVDLSPCDGMKMMKLSGNFFYNSDRSCFGELLKNERSAATLFGILAQKYPSAESIDTKDKETFRYLLRYDNMRIIANESNSIIIEHPELSGEIFYFIQDRDLNTTFLDKLITFFKKGLSRSPDDCPDPNQFQIYMNWCKKSKQSLEVIKSNLASYERLSLITAAAAAFLTSYQQKS